MYKNLNTLNNALQILGIDQEDAKVFTSLVEGGPLTVVQLSRVVRINRTKIYRILENLVAKGLINEQIGAKGKIYHIPEEGVFDLLIEQERSKVAALERTKEEAERIISIIGNTKPEESRVTYYRGIEGLKQVNWNTTKANGIVRIYEIKRTMNDFLDKDFAEQIRLEYLKNGVHVNQITNLNRINDYTNITDFVEMTEIRYISPTQLEIDFEILIYDDTYLMYQYLDNEPFCVEIHNPKLAQMQKQLFDFVWEKSEPLKTVSKYGASEK